MNRTSGTCGAMTKELHLCHEAPFLGIIFNLLNVGYLYIQLLRAYSIRFIKTSKLLRTTLKHLSLNIKLSRKKKKKVILGLHFAKAHVLLPGPKTSHEPNQSLMVRIIYSTKCNQSLLSTCKRPDPWNFTSVLPSWHGFLLSGPHGKFPFFQQI